MQREEPVYQEKLDRLAAAASRNQAPFWLPQSQRGATAGAHKRWPRAECVLRRGESHTLDRTAAILVRSQVRS
jgi:hypothetical protein